MIASEVQLQIYFNQGAENIIRRTFKIDSAAIRGHHEIRDDGLMQYGFTKDHRSDLPQVKMMVCSEGVSGCPLVSEIAQGNLNDDMLYLPALKRMRKAFDTKGYLYCGDSKMSSNKIRSDIVKHGEFYLCPLHFIYVLFN